MQELIDRYATMDAIPAPTDADEAEYYGKVCDAIEAMPTIKSEARRGRWIETRYCPVGDTMYCDCNCSNCNFEITRERGWYPKFCENCGADMRTADIKD